MRVRCQRINLWEVSMMTFWMLPTCVQKQMQLQNFLFAHSIEARINPGALYYVHL